MRERREETGWGGHRYESGIGIETGVCPERDDAENERRDILNRKVNKNVVNMMEMLNSSCLVVEPQYGNLEVAGSNPALVGFSSVFLVAYMIIILSLALLFVKSVIKMAIEILKGLFP